jgi:hypothetical protein
LSVLAWVFGLGALAIAAPILFHLIRRTPKGETEFSSLMFLKPSPPTLTRRSRLENLFLLFLRALALALIAFAFMRPFFPSSNSLSSVEVANRRVAILLDTSASMQREGLWEAAQAKVESVLDELEDGDDVSLFLFDQNVRELVPFANGVDAQSTDRASLVRKAAKESKPTWARSDLGRAMVMVADRLDVWRDQMKEKEDAKVAKLQIVVISDLQKGTKVDALQAYQWPSAVFTKFESVQPEKTANATVQLLNSSEEDEKGSARIRVVNSGELGNGQESSNDQFSVTLQDELEKQTYDPIDFYVPAGTSRVIKVDPEDVVDATRFSVSGDGESFDNTFYAVPSEQLKLDVVYLGKDQPNDPDQPQFYLKSALVESSTRLPVVRAFQPGDSMIRTKQKPALAVVASSMTQDQANEVDDYLAQGGLVLVLLTDPETTDSTTRWTGATATDGNDGTRRQREYQMLADIEFSHPLFQPFNNARFNDFTKIRFWKHQPVELDEDSVDVIAVFDNDAPAIWQRKIGAGTVITMATSWQPDQSQLALSSKFVPLINGLVEMGAGISEMPRSLLVGNPIQLPPSKTAETNTRTLVKPDGTRETILVGQTEFVETDLPGIYRLVDGSNAGELKFAVNLDRAESETAVIPVEQIELFNVKVGEQQTASSELSQLRDMKDREIEGQQKIWKWLIVVAIVLLIVETWVAGRAADKLVADTGALQPS